MMRVSSPPQTASATAERREQHTMPRLPIITPEARRYAVKELARRSGVPLDFFRKWQIDVTVDKTTISFGPEIRGKVHFAHSSLEHQDRIAGPAIPVARASVSKLSPVHGLILPFCEPQPSPLQPLYQFANPETLVCRLDVLRSYLFTLSRVEEILGNTFDEHARFPALASVACSHEFLERPILDEHGLAFEQALAALIPAWQPQPRTLTVKLTHDIDDVGIPFRVRTALAHSLKRGQPFASLRDLLSSATALEPSELAQVRRLAEMSKSRDLHSAFYWKASPPGPHDSGYDPKLRKIQFVIRFLKDLGFELGVHPGYDTFGDCPKLAAEIGRLREVLQTDVRGGRQHYLRWNPNTWRDWEFCGLSYDSSVGFADRFGFRAGTAVPYRPWCFAENRELNLIELPLILMDCTPLKYMRLGKADGLQRIRALFQRMEHTGGVFTLLWHNTPLLDPDYDGWYESILDILSTAKRYEFPCRPTELW